MCSQFVCKICLQKYHIKTEKKKEKNTEHYKNVEVQEMTHLPYVSYRDF